MNILITGANRGIGLALTKVFLENNHKVIGTSRNGIIRELSHSNFCSIKLDLSNPDSIENATDVLKHMEPIDILINNAGIGSDLNTILPNRKTFQDTFNVNVTGTVFFTEAMIRQINTQGKIINISSQMSAIMSCDLFDSVAYRMSKSALNMYTKILSNRLKDRIFVASLHPGWVKTEISKSNKYFARLSSEESARLIFEFAMSEFESGIFWNVEKHSEMLW